MFDLPPTTPASLHAEPVATLERVVERPSDSGLWDYLAITRDTRLITGGTAYVPTTGAITSGDLPPPWVSPVPHADWQAGAGRPVLSTRGAL